MSKKDKDRQWIDRHVDVPVVSYDWQQEEHGLLVKRDACGLIEEWRLVKERIKKRRSPLPVGSELWKACEEALKLCDFITQAGMAGAILGDWCPSHRILAEVANIYEARVGRIDPLVQAVIRDAMDEAYTSERFTS